MDSLPNYPSYRAPLTRALLRARGATLSYKLYKFSIFQFRLSLVTIHICPGEDLQTFYLSEARGRTFHDLISPSLVRLMKSSTSGLGLNHCEIAPLPLQRWALFLNSTLNPIQPSYLSNLESHNPIYLLKCVLSLDFLNSTLNPIQPSYLSNLESHNPIYLLICVLSLDLIRLL